MDRVKLKRGGQVMAPTLFTMGNMACGFYCLIASSLGDFYSAATAILGGIVFDMLDGRVARMVHGESPFGVEFDSLSDFLTFGVAPAYMMYSFVLKDFGLFGGATAFLFALCGGMRLARFNAAAFAGAVSKSHFQGLPIPGAAGFLASFVLLYQIVEEQRPAKTLGFVMDRIYLLAAIGPVLMLVLGFLMVSTIPYAAFKQKSLFERQNAPLLVLVAAALALVYRYPQNTVFLIFLVYVFSGPTGILGKGRRPSEPEAPPAGPTAP